MTRKETEQKCREVMQENIPDKEALWMRIEAGLPVQERQPEGTNRRPVQSVIVMRRILTMVACFLLVIGGLRMYRNGEKIRESKSMENTSRTGDLSENSGLDLDADADADDFVHDDAPADVPAMDADPADADQELIKPENPGNSGELKNNQEILRYEDLQVLNNRDIRDNTDVSRLGVADVYFNESDILSKTELFLDVKVLNGYQNPETGEMQYILKILDVYGGELELPEFVMTSRSAYILEKNHEYVIPVYQNSGDATDLRPVCECAPQIEKTQDHQIIFPNGWQTVMESVSDADPVLYDSYGTEDYFYDRMYLTGDTAIEILLQTWEKNL